MEGTKELLVPTNFETQWEIFHCISGHVNDLLWPKAVVYYPAFRVIPDFSSRVKFV